MDDKSVKARHWTAPEHDSEDRRYHSSAAAAKEHARKFSVNLKDGIDVFAGANLLATFRDGKEVAGVE